MNKLISTAKKLSTFFKILDIILTIAIVACCVGALISAAGLIFNVPAEYIGTDLNSFSIDFLELTIAEEYAPALDTILWQLLTATLLAAICTFILKQAVKCVRDMLSTMENGEPFNSVVSESLKKIGKYSIVLGIVENILIISERLFFVYGFGLAEILAGEKISAVTVEYNLDFSFLLIAAILFLLSYVFKYGKELQTQSDETL